MTFKTVFFRQRQDLLSKLRAWGPWEKGEEEGRGRKGSGEKYIAQLKKTIKNLKTILFIFNYFWDTGSIHCYIDKNDAAMRNSQPSSFCFLSLRQAACVLTGERR